MMDFMCVFPKDLNFMDDFVATHKTFMSTEDFIGRLIYLYQNAEAHFNIPSDSVFNVKLRIVNAIRKFLMQYTNETPQVKYMIEEFIASLEQTEKSFWKILSKVNRDRSKYVDDFMPEPIINGWYKKSSPNVFNMNPKEFARQLSLRYMMHYQEINIDNIISIYRGENIEIMQMINELASKVSCYVSSTILLNKDIKKQAAVLEFFVKTCQEFVKMNNFQAAVDIFTGIDHFLVNRLKRTWKRLDEEIIGIWETLKSMLSPLHSWNHIREAFKKCSPPCTFPAVVIQRDLLTINENDEFWDKEKKLINFEKCRLVSNVVHILNKCKAGVYQFHEVPEIQNKISSLQEVDEEFLETIYDTLNGVKDTKQKRRSFLKQDKKPHHV
eukprot:TRINITY_DN4530_c0_g2_i1.p1 TRINITY_DN4530_c0_g2~~TRINITY_DN4530_c0_g2_i1.p1  ORF type:complete len:383 (+),score=64.94 TRINITY_DN4530_c0_g2_i1:848-1996(+)